MEQKKLNETELTALAGLIQRLVFADNDVSLAEKAGIDKLIAQIGEASYREALDRFGKISRKGDPAILELLASVTDQDTRDYIFGTLFELASVDSIDESEGTILDWLIKNWNITVQRFRM